METLVFEQLKNKHLTITTAESCTGGLLSARLINVSGISTYLGEAYVTYCDEAKRRLLGVRQETLNNDTAVSEQCAFEMAEGGAKAASADICLAVTGVAGPDDEGEDFPAGLVYIGCYYRGNTIVNRFNFEGDRQAVREQAVEKALEILLEIMESEK